MATTEQQLFSQLAIYAREHDEAGGCLHIYLDDGNCGEYALRACLETALAADDVAAQGLARALLDVSERQREQFLTGLGIDVH